MKYLLLTIFLSSIAGSSAFAVRQNSQAYITIGAVARGVTYIKDQQVCKEARPVVQAASIAEAPEAAEVFRGSPSIKKK